MELVRIFVSEETHEGLYTVCYEDGGLDELERLLDAWNDTEYVTNYCNDNIQFLKADFYTEFGISLGDAINRILKEAEYLSDDLDDFTNDSFEKGSPLLQTIFKPLGNQSQNLPSLQKTKFKREDRRLYKSPLFLRLYALRIGPNTFVITGGAIKLTKAMDEHHDTRLELNKLEAVKAFLKDDLEVQNDEDLKYYYDSEG